MILYHFSWQFNAYIFLFFNFTFPSISTVEVNNYWEIILRVFSTLPIISPFLSRLPLQKDLPGSPAKPQPQIPIDVTSLRLDHEPVLFLRRYERLFDMSLVRPAADRREKEEEEAAAEKKRKKEEEADSDVSERVNFVLKTFQATNSFDNMLNRMRPSKPQEWDELLGRNKESLEANLQQALDGPRQHAKPTWVAVDSVAEKPSPVLDKLVELSMKTMETIGLVPAAKANEEAKEEAKKVTELELQTGSGKGREKGETTC